MTPKLEDAAARFAEGKTRSFALVEVTDEGVVNCHWLTAMGDLDEYLRLLCGVDTLAQALGAKAEQLTAASGERH